MTFQRSAFPVLAKPAHVSLSFAIGCWNTFEIEDEIATEFCESRPSSLEVQAAQRQALRDHEQLLARMDELNEKLLQLEPPFASWQEAVQQIGLVMDMLEQHEEQESENIQW